MKLSASAHCVFNLKAHIIFVVAYRRKAISGEILDCIGKTLQEICNKYKAKISEFSGESDHVHLLVEYPPSVRLADLVRSMKSGSSRVIRLKFRKEIKDKLWEKDFGVEVIV